MTFLCGVSHVADIVLDTLARVKDNKSITHLQSVLKPVAFDFQWYRGAAASLLDADVNVSFRLNDDTLPPHRQQHVRATYCLARARHVWATAPRGEWHALPVRVAGFSGPSADSLEGGSPASKLLPPSSRSLISNLCSQARVYLKQAYDEIEAIARRTEPSARSHKFRNSLSQELDNCLMLMLMSFMYDEDMEGCYTYFFGNDDADEPPASFLGNPFERITLRVRLLLSMRRFDDVVAVVRTFCAESYPPLVFSGGKRSLSSKLSQDIGPESTAVGQDDHFLIESLVQAAFASGKLAEEVVGLVAECGQGSAPRAASFGLARLSIAKLVLTLRNGGDVSSSVVETVDVLFDYMLQWLSKPTTAAELVQLLVDQKLEYTLVLQVSVGLLEKINGSFGSFTVDSDDAGVSGPLNRVWGLVHSVTCSLLTNADSAAAEVDAAEGAGKKKKKKKKGGEDKERVRGQYELATMCSVWHELMRVAVSCIEDGQAWEIVKPFLCVPWASCSWLYAAYLQQTISVSSKTYGDVQACDILVVCAVQAAQLVCRVAKVSKADWHAALKWCFVMLETAAMRGSSHYRILTCTADICMMLGLRLYSSAVVFPRFQLKNILYVSTGPLYSWSLGGGGGYWVDRYRSEVYDRSKKCAVPVGTKKSKVKPTGLLEESDGSKHGGPVTAASHVSMGLRALRDLVCDASCANAKSLMAGNGAYVMDSWSMVSRMNHSWSSTSLVAIGAVQAVWSAFRDAGTPIVPSSDVLDLLRAASGSGCSQGAHSASNKGEKPSHGGKGSGKGKGGAKGKRGKKKGKGGNTADARSGGESASGAARGDAAAATPVPCLFPEAKFKSWALRLAERLASSLCQYVLCEQQGHCDERDCETVNASEAGLTGFWAATQIAGEVPPTHVVQRLLAAPAALTSIPDHMCNLWNLGTQKSLKLSVCPYSTQLWKLICVRASSGDAYDSVQGSESAEGNPVMASWATSGSVYKRYVSFDVDPSITGLTASTPPAFSVCVHEANWDLGRGVEYFNKLGIPCGPPGVDSGLAAPTLCVDPSPRVAPSSPCWYSSGVCPTDASGSAERTVWSFVHWSLPGQLRALQSLCCGRRGSVRCGSRCHGPAPAWTRICDVAGTGCGTL